MSFSDECMKVLNNLCGSENIKLLVYCLMPDHIHLLIKTLEGSDIILFVRKFKSIVSKLAKQYFGIAYIWQKSFYDHFLRKEEAINKVAEYILNNPVRKNIVSEWKEYKLSGTIFDL